MPPPGARLIPLLALSLLALTACSSTQSARTSEEPSYTRSNASVQNGTLEPELRSEARRWEGVPHRLGGTDRRGIDCSALTQVLYADVLGLDLPRETRRQSRVGTEIRRSNLQPGDLVFFRPGRKQRHVGIYLSNGEFVHASSSTGVTVSSLHTDYWQRTWWQARRVLPENPRVQPNPETRSVSSTDDSRRSGW
ncbi:hypothetical protein CRI94_01460 [Longibacter salinarum]|uniref:NlpC/P60 domain-containing protein n=1 Tax=Longibacter salinarum TaxID=1850348 RepID=A0A2A8D3J2_9BACT|nr:NlpC/P60 family protein [Longibacter salinarum]PEN15387.1 hypothetical protein CRI94_01460 [Longibacter salinarum]